MTAAKLKARTVIAPGNYDGVHVGHRALVSRARALAVQLDAQAAVMTFDPHPVAYFAKDRAPAQLTTFGRRAELLKGAGAEVVIVEPFDAATANLTPLEFIDDVLVDRHGAVGVVVGPDFRFGRERKGDVALLRDAAKARGMIVEVSDPVIADGAPASSSRVRALLADGDVARAARLLTRPHDVDGVVIRGHGRARTLGFPTANLDTKGIALPKDGVYAVRVLIDGTSVAGVANIGVRPTFTAGRAFEVHLLDFSRDLYGETLRVAFVDRVRDEKKFAGIEALVAALNADIAQARAILRSRTT